MGKTDIIQTHNLIKKIRKDFYRPKFHFCVPFDLGFPADPNAIFFANGTYHLMFIYQSRLDSYRWGHAISRDLLHWSFLEDALIPDTIDGGIYSGGVFLDEDKKAIVSYWALGKDGGSDGIRIAIAYPPNYEKWTKLDGYAIKCSQLGIAQDNFGNELAAADPSNIWKENDTYYMQTGNLTLLDKYRGKNDERYQGDWTDLFYSKDLINWTYRHRFYDRVSDNSFTDISEDCMCPWFGKLPDKNGADSGKYIQFFLAHNRGTQYYIGEYDNQAMKFIISAHGRMSFEDNCLFAPEALRCNDGRLILFNWMRDNLDDNLKRELNKGWSGIHSIPREIFLREDGKLGVKPIRELNNLRLNSYESSFSISAENQNIFVDDSLSCELNIAFSELTSDKAGLRIVFGEKSFVDIYYSTQDQKLVIDNTVSGTCGRKIKDCAPLKLLNGELLNLTIYIDGCTLEVFANESQEMTRKNFPKNNIKPTLQLLGKNSAKVIVYTIAPTNCFI